MISHAHALIFLLIVSINAKNSIKTNLKVSSTFDELRVRPPMIETYQINAYCYVNLNGIVYNLEELYDAATDYYFFNATNYFYYNFCKFGNTKCQKENSYVVYTDKSSANSTLCKVISGSNYDRTPEWKITRDNYNQSTWLEITLPPGERCDIEGKSSFYSTVYQLTCDKDVPRVAVDNPNKVNISSCRNIIQMRSKYACPDDTVYSLSNSVRENRVLFGLILMFCGLYYCFASYRFLKATRISTGIVIILFFSLFLFANIFNLKFSSLSLWGIFILSALVGLFFGLLISKHPWIVSALLGGLLGFVISELVFQAFASLITWNPKAVYYIMFSVSVVTGAGLGALYQRHIFIVACALGGGYSVMRGLGVLDDNFPNERQIYDLIERHEWPQLYTILDYRFYLYLFFSLVLGVCGAVFQYKTSFKDIKGDDTAFNKAD